MTTEAAAAAAAAAEEAVRFPGPGGNLFGILHLPDGTADPSACLLMVVGGPQTRVGSHRSYTLIARELCRRGVPVLRFDYAGIGDSDGDYVGFSDAGPSIKSAVDWLYGRFPSLRKVIAWSLCDGAAACALFVPVLGPRVSAMILCNPYVHSQEGRAKTFLKYYYLWRLLDRGFWRKLFSFQVNPFTVLASFLSLARKALGGGDDHSAAPAANSGAGATSGAATAPSVKAALAIGGTPSVDPPQLAEKVLDGLRAFRGKVVLFLSDDDFTAREFLDLYRAREGSKGRNSRPIGAELRRVEDSDHTFSSRASKARICDMTLEAWKALH